MVEIRELTPTKRNLRKFVDFPMRLYRGNPNFVPNLRYEEAQTLDPKFNAAYEFCRTRMYMAYKDGKAAGRVCAIVNERFNTGRGVRWMRFTRLDFIDDEEVVDALMSRVEDWARQEGLSEVHGPIGFCDLDRQGMLVDGFDQPSMFITIYNAPYYMKHLERLGYVKDADWIERVMDVQASRNEKLSRMSELLLKRFRLHTIPFRKPKDVLPYVRDVFELYNEAYSKLYGMSPLTPKQIDMYVGQYFSFINPAYVCMVYDEHNIMAGFGFGIPSIAAALRKSNGYLFPLGWLYMLRALRQATTVELLLIAVRSELQGKGVNAILIDEILKKMLENGILWAETGPTLEDNKEIQGQWNHFTGRTNKRRRCYIKYLRDA